LAIFASFLSTEDCELPTFVKKQSMKNLFLVNLILTIFFFSCNSNTEATETEEEINETEVTEKREIEAESEQVPEETTNESKGNNFDLNEILTVFNKGGMLPQKYYSLFNLETSDYEEAFEIFLKPKKLNDFYILALGSESSLERDDAYIDFYVFFYTLNKNGIISKSILDFAIEDSRPVISSIQNDLIKTSVDIGEYIYKDGVHKSSGKTLTQTQFISIVDNSNLKKIVIPPYYTSVKELRLFRNEIFARYGYKFKSTDLQEYFSKFDWYKPKYDNVDKYLASTDKEVIKYVKLLETQKQ